jgi:hypothetical protein
MPNVTGITASAREHAGHLKSRNSEASMIRIAAALAALSVMIAAGFAEDAPKKEPFIIGDATMTEDGTIVINLRRTRDGINVSGIVKYAVDDRHYKEVLDHLDGMKPGETKLVPAWDDPVPEKK